MRLTLDLPTDVSIALRRFATEQAAPEDQAAIAALRDWLVAQGYLEEEHDLEDMEPEGSA